MKTFARQVTLGRSAAPIVTAVVVTSDVPTTSASQLELELLRCRGQAVSLGSACNSFCNNCISSVFLDDDHTLTVLTPKGGTISAGSPLDPNSGAVFESDDNFDAVSRSSHTENIYFPTSFPGGQYMFFVDVIAQVGTADRWRLEVIEFGETVVIETGFGYSEVFAYIAPECKTTQHCRKGEVCFNNRCIMNGTPRFTLTWTGDDDLDLSVTPPLGNKVDWWYQFDSRSGGSMQEDTTPMGTSHVESIYFGVSRQALTGRYIVEVDPYETNGGGSDPWKLKVSVRGKVAKSWSGTGKASFRFWYGG
jgi:hypothetical protein